MCLQAWRAWPRSRCPGPGCWRPRTSPGTSWPAAGSTRPRRWPSWTSRSVPAASAVRSTYSLLQWYFGPGDSPFLQWVPGSGTQPQSVDSRAGAGDNLFRSRIQVRTRGLVHVLCDVTRGLVHVLCYVTRGLVHVLCDVTRGLVHVLCVVTRGAVAGAARVPEHHGGGGGGHGVQSAAGDTWPPNTATCHVLLPGGARAAAQRAPVRLLHLQGGHLLHRAPVQPHPHHLRWVPRVPCHVCHVSRLLQTPGWAPRCTTWRSRPWRWCSAACSRSTPSRASPSRSTRSRGPAPRRPRSPPPRCAAGWCTTWRWTRASPRPSSRCRLCSPAPWRYPAPSSPWRRTPCTAPRTSGINLKFLNFDTNWRSLIVFWHVSRTSASHVYSSEVRSWPSHVAALLLCCAACHLGPILGTTWQ